MYMNVIASIWCQCLQASRAQESPDSWEAVLAGVAELCAGLASAVASMGADPALLGDLLPAGSLTALLAACPTPTAARALMGMATALPFLPGAQDVRIRWAEQIGCSHVRADSRG